MKNIEMAIMKQKKTRDGGLVEVDDRGGGCGVEPAWPRRVNIEAELPERLMTRDGVSFGETRAGELGFEWVRSKEWSSWQLEL